MLVTYPKKMRGMKTTARFALSAAAMSCVVLVDACGSPPPTALPTAQQLLAAGRTALETFQSFQMSGTFMTNQEAGEMSATVLRNGDAHGSLGFGSGLGSDFVRAGSVMYFDELTPFVLAAMDTQTADLAQRLQGFLHWWQTAGSSSAQNAMQLIGVHTIEPAFLGNASRFGPASKVSVGGRQLLKTADPGESVYFLPSQPYRIVEIRTVNTLLVDNLSAVDITFTNFDAKAGVEVPANPLVPDPKLMPAEFLLQSAHFDGQCSRSGCPVKATVSADAGSGTATVNFTLKDANGNNVGSCTTTAIVSAVNQTASTGCRATGPGYARFWAGNSSVDLFATVDDPNYGASQQ
jgi:hypothetical protein